MSDLDLEATASTAQKQSVENLEGTDNDVEQDDPANTVPGEQLQSYEQTNGEDKTSALDNLDHQESYHKDPGNGADISNDAAMDFTSQAAIPKNTQTVTKDTSLNEKDSLLPGQYRDFTTLEDNSLLDAGEATDKVSGSLSHNRVSTRNRTYTEKGLEYHIGVLVNKMKATLRGHEQLGKKCEQMIDNNEYVPSKLLDLRFDLEQAIGEVSAAFYELGNFSVEKQNEFQVKFDHCTGVNRLLLGKVNQALRIIESVNANISTASDHHSDKHKHESKSRRSKSSHSKKSHSSRSSESSRSKSSRHSVISLTIEAASKAAALKARLDFHEAEAESKVKLEKLSLLRDIAVEEAKLKAISSFPDALASATSTIPVPLSNVSEATLAHVSSSMGSTYVSGSNLVSAALVGSDTAQGTYVTASVPTANVYTHKASPKVTLPSASMPALPSSSYTPSSLTIAGGTYAPTSIVAGNTYAPTSVVAGNTYAPASDPSKGTYITSSVPPLNKYAPATVHTVSTFDTVPILSRSTYAPAAVSAGGTYLPAPSPAVGAEVSMPIPSVSIPAPTPVHTVGISTPALVSHSPHSHVLQPAVPGLSHPHLPTHQIAEHVNGDTPNNNDVSHSSLNHNAHEFLPLNTNIPLGVNSCDIPSGSHSGAHCSGSCCHTNKLAPPEPRKFLGDPLQYPAWRSEFFTLIESQYFKPHEKVGYLKRYIGGKALEGVEGYLSMPSEDGYNAAIRLIEQRFGNNFVIAQAFKAKIEKWPKINGRDALGLRKFCDFLRQCEVAARSNLSLRVLDDDTQNHLMLSKLPDWLKSRWARIVYDASQRQGRYPCFSEFVSFLTRESDIACNPSTMAPSHRASMDLRSGEPQEKGAAGSTARTLNTSLANDKCLFCDKNNHALDKCFKFRDKQMEEKKEFIVKNHICFGCFKFGHSSKQCKDRLVCSICAKRHPTPLHGDVKDNKSRDSGNGQKSKGELDKPGVKNNQNSGNKVATSHVSLFASKETACRSTMILPVYVSHKDNAANEVLVYALLDSQSDTSFISSATYSRLAVNGVDTTLRLSTMTDDGGILRCKRIKGLSVRGFNSSLNIALPVVYTHESIPVSRDAIPTPEMAASWPHLQCIESELMPKSDCDIGLLLGYDCPKVLVPRDVIPPENDGPFAQRTDLGWGIVGSGRNSNSGSVYMCEKTSGLHIALRTSGKEVVLPEFVSSMADDVGNPFEKGLSLEDQCFLELMEKEIHKTGDGHYEMPLPFRDPGKLMTNNKVLALQRLNSLAKRFKRDPLYHQHYVTFMNDLLQNEYAERVPENELGPETPAYYLPHHGVYNASKPGKVRVVMDASAKYMGESLNSNLLTGPDLLNGLVGVLCRFRQGYVAFSCDIKGMFQQFRVNPEHRNFLRFLWFEEGDFDRDPVALRSRVHLFGAVSSPAVANFGLRKAAQDGLEKYGQDVVDFIVENFYVDDGLKSLDSEDDAIAMIENSRKLCLDSGLILHKFTSNSAAVLASLDPRDRSDNTKDLDLRHDVLPMERALGIKWCMQSDSFNFRVVVSSKPLTRRGVLSTVSSIFDPLRLISPVVLEGKMILQEMCRRKLDWDDPLPECLHGRWSKWLDSLPSLEQLSIARCFKPAVFGKVRAVELHHFSDACNKGYGQCSYLRITDEENRVHCSLVMAKSRVTPLRVVTIPRLELTAAVLSTEVSQLLDKELQYDIKHIFWTDSRIVLGFINNEAKRFHVYVSNRVQTIRNVSEPEQWHHVETGDNPADLASRGATCEELGNSSWFKGPDFLWNADLQPLTATTELDDSNPEIRKGVCFDTTHTEVEPFPVRLTNWTRTKRVLAYCLRFINKMRKKSGDSQSLTVAELVAAEQLLIKHAQNTGFADDLELLRRNKVLSKSSKLRHLDVFLDDNGLIRVGGRMKHGAVALEIKHPVVMPKENQISDLIVQHCHKKIAHQGRGMTTNEVRNEGFWVQGLSSKVATLVYKCVICRKLRASCQQQKMGELPSECVEAGPLFTYVAVDYFGPFRIREGRRDVKRYGVLFVCLNSRAIHIEVAKTLETDSFINALRRFLSVRGPIRVLRSDQGTNLVGAYRELREAISNIDDEKVKEFVLQYNCDYLVNVPHASHQGGAWERQIRSLRSVFNALIGSNGHLLDDDGFRTFMAEATHIVNSRPLTVTSLNDPMSLQPLTPNHLLTMKSNVVLPPPGVFQTADTYCRKRWRRVQYLLDSFWTRWKSEVLALWQTRQKWCKSRRNLQVGDVVLLVDEQLARCQWRLGRIVEVYPGQDPLVRKVKLMVGDPGLTSKGVRKGNPKYLERPVQKLILLLENTE